MNLCVERDSRITNKTFDLILFDFIYFMKSVKDKGNTYNNTHTLS